MVKMTVQTRMDVKKVLRKKKRGNLDSLGKAGAYVRTVMSRTIGSNKKPRPPGRPMTSPTRRAKKSILFHASKETESVVIGPSHRIMGKSMHAHEFGRKHKGVQEPARPFAVPSLEKSQEKLSPFWRGSITE